MSSFWFTDTKQTDAPTEDPATVAAAVWVINFDHLVRVMHKRANHEGGICTSSDVRVWRNDIVLTAPSGTGLWTMATDPAITDRDLARIVRDTLTLGHVPHIDEETTVDAPTVAGYAAIIAEALSNR